MDLDSLTKTRLSIDILHKDILLDRLVYEGPVEMTPEQIDSYKQLKGDEKATVTASRDVSEMDFGTGGKVFVSVTLTVDQSTQGIESGYQWATYFVNKKVWEAHDELKRQLVEKGLLKP